MADSDDFDVYYMWLGISPEERPAHHYRLLDVKVFESNADAIEMGYNRRMLYLRSIKDGDRLDEAQQLQNKLSEARVCLLNREKKTTYDADLRRRLAQQSNPPTATPAWTSPPVMAAPPPSPPAATRPPVTMHPAMMPPPNLPPPLPPARMPPPLMPPRSLYAERPQAPPQSPYFPSVPPPMIDDLEIVDEFGGEPALPRFGTRQELFDQTFRNSRPSRDWTAGPSHIVRSESPPPTRFSFEGRTTRQEFWESIGIVIAALFAITILNLVTTDLAGSAAFAGFLTFIAAIVTIWFSLAVQVRRWHDVGATGWCILILLIPWLGAGIALLVLGCVPGSGGPNHFGESPLADGDRFASSRGGRVR